MATAALPLAPVAPMFFNEFRYEVLKQLRNKMYAFSTLGFPVLFYLLFGLVNKHGSLDGFSVAKYLVASYCIFGMMGSALFGVGVGLAIERGNGWLDLKRASPMPPAALLFAKCLSAACFAMVTSCLVMLCGVVLGGVHLSVLEVLKVLGIVCVGTVPFAALGLAISFMVSATAAPGVMNLIYLPMSFCSGVWIPITMLPKWVQAFAPVLPGYHLAQLAFRSFGFQETGASDLVHWAAVLAETAVFLAVAGVLYKRANSRS